MPDTNERLKMILLKTKNTCSKCLSIPNKSHFFGLTDPSLGKCRITSYSDRRTAAPWHSLVCLMCGLMKRGWIRHASRCYLLYTLDIFLMRYLYFSHVLYHPSSLWLGHLFHLFINYWLYLVLMVILPHRHHLIALIFFCEDCGKLCFNEYKWLLQISSLGLVSTLGTAEYKMNTC